MKKRRIDIVMILVLLLYGASLSAQSPGLHSPNVDSLENVLHAIPPESAELLRIYSDLSSYYTANYMPGRNREYAQKGIELARKLHNSYEMALLYNNLGSAYDDLSQRDSAMIYYNTALHLIGEMEDENRESAQNIGLLKGISCSNIGNLYNVQGFSDKAVQYYLKAITLFEEFNVTNRLAKTLRNIALVYTNMKNYQQAEQYLNRGMEINKLLRDSLGMASTLTRLGHIYVNQLKYPQALQCAEEADNIYAHYAEKRDLRIYNLRVLCAIWNNGFENERKAMEYALQALDESKKMGIKLEISRSLQLIAALHVEYKRYDRAERAAMEALQTDSTNLTNNILLYESLTTSHAGLGNITRMQAFFDRYKAATATYSNESFQSSLSEMEVKYETEKKEIRIADLEKERRLIMWLGITGGTVLLLALAALFFLWRWMAQKKRLSEQKIRQLEQEKQLVATQAVLDGEIQERTRLARDLHDGLGSLLTGSKMNIEDLKKDAQHGKIDVERIDNALMMLNDSSHELRRIAHHLMPDTLSRFGLKVSVNDFCNAQPNVNFSWYGDETRLEPKLEAMIYRTIHELVNNALKHAHASQILVQIIQETARIAFTVQDDGCGFDPSTASGGMGMQNIRTRVASFGGIINIVSTSGEGTEANIELRIENEK